jgi:hypothetical protein
LSLPPRTPAGDYRLAVRVIDPRARAGLPVATGQPADGDWVTLRTVIVE